ncbi:MAG: DoxX family protein [Spirochaetaceae bacterium]|nr:DoxX family protein [Spirochaetaceae bacterium]|tara:strand:- start:99165 stop:99566 length:402 start_codon:yes stop_codon:yes gene_type:complete
MENLSKPWKIVVIVLRTIMGLIFIASAVVVLFGLVEPPTDMPENVQKFQDGMQATGYLLPLIKVTELICGILLVSGFYVALASVIIFPITLNITLYHLFVFEEGLPVALFLLAVNLILAYVNREKYRPLFQRK